MKQEFIHKAFMDNILSGPAISKHENPKKLMIMLHGYGDNAANFVHLAEPLDLDEWGMHYVALNAPSIMPGNPMGYQWFDLYINGIYISDAGSKEYAVINKIIRDNVSKINNTISLILENLKLEMKDCFIMGFSQGGMMAFELGKSIKSQLGGVGIISSRIIKKDETPNSFFQQTPIFISHGAQDDVLPILNFNQSIDILRKDNYNFESHLIEKDTHTISPDTIKLFQNFIKKNI